MGLIDSLFATPGVDAFAKALVQDVAKRHPSALDQDLAKCSSVNRLVLIQNRPSRLHVGQDFELSIAPC